MALALSPLCGDNINTRFAGICFIPVWEVFFKAQGKHKCDAQNIKTYGIFNELYL